MGKITVIGLGGIGSSLIEPLVRFTQYNKVCEFTLIDGDLYELKNANRQRVSINELNRSKSDVCSERMRKIFDCVKINSVHTFITPTNIRRYINENDIVMMCVDNHATRKLVQEHCSRLRTVTLISGGNNYTDGNVQVFRKERGKILSAPITTHHPEIEFPSDKRPDEVGCDEAVASCMLNAYYAIINNQLNYSEVYFDIISNKTKTFQR